MAARQNKIYFQYLDNSDFVQETILDRSKPRCIIEFFLLSVINPFTVSMNAFGSGELK